MLISQNTEVTEQHTLIPVAFPVMAQNNVIETKVDGDHVMNGEAVQFQIKLDRLKGIDPLLMEFDAECSIKQMTVTLQQHLKLNQSLKLQTHIPFDSVPQSFNIKVGETDIVDFNSNQFSISKSTRFVEYWNDFLDAANRVDEEKDNDQIEGEIQFDGTLKAKLNGTTLKIGDAFIDFQRTLRIPDDDKTC